jgi:serine/threonine protein kinase
MSQDDIRLFADLLGKMFKWRPEDRATMDEVVNHPWIRDGADGMDCS